VEKGEHISSTPDVEDMPTIATPRSYVSSAYQAPAMPQTLSIAPQTPAVAIKRHVPGADKVPTIARSGKLRRGLVAGIVAACIILALLIGGTIFITAHSGVGINPLQTMNNATLGVSMSYPTGWHEVSTPSALTLADSSNTAQMKIARVSASSPIGALQQQATQLGMSNGTMESPVTFGNCTWQRMTGNFQVRGADYSGTIYACSHSNHIYTLVQMFPKSQYADEETVVFAPARASLQLK
jgi:hypothetical protein